MENQIRQRGFREKGFIGGGKIEEFVSQGERGVEESRCKTLGYHILFPAFCIFFTKHTIGRQLFEKNRNLEDETTVEDDAVSVDFSQYERTTENEIEEEGLTFSDSE